MRTWQFRGLLCVAVFGAERGPVAAQARPQIAGITYIVGAERDDGEEWSRGAFKTFAGVVVFAAGRGRLDIDSVSEGPRLRADGIETSALLATRGDYYLFDSTGFILVRPGSHTFSSFQLTDAAYDYRYSREGWPTFFDIKDAPSPFDTVRSLDVTRQFGEVRVYWHLNLIVGGIVAGGRIAVRDAPPGEATVVRWFGPSQALANMTASGATLPKGIASLTAVLALHPPVGNRPRINFITEHMIWGIKPIDVDQSRLVLPDGFTETKWPGFDGQPNTPPISADEGAKWRVRPANHG